MSMVKLSVRLAYKFRFLSTLFYSFVQKSMANSVRAQLSLSLKGDHCNAVQTSNEVDSTVLNTNATNKVHLCQQDYQTFN